MEPGQDGTTIGISPELRAMIWDFAMVLVSRGGMDLMSAVRKAADGVLEVQNALLQDGLNLSPTDGPAVYLRADREGWYYDASGLVGSEPSEGPAGVVLDFVSNASSTPRSDRATRDGSSSDSNKT